MTTNVTTTSASANALAALGGLKQNLQAVAAAAPSRGGDPILKFDKGTWLYGADNVEPEKGSLWAVNPLSFQNGWICWKHRAPGSADKSELLGEIVVPAGHAVPVKASLPDYGPQNEWKEMLVCELRCATGEDEGEQVVFKPSSKGGIAGGKDVLNAIIKQIDDDPAHPVPLVALESDSYMHTDKQIGKVFVPVLRIVRWVSMEGVEVPAAETAKVEPVKETAQVSQQAANDEDDNDTTQQEPAQQAEAGGERRRRRRAA